MDTDAKEVHLSQMYEVFLQVGIIERGLPNRPWRDPPRGGDSSYLEGGNLGKMTKNKLECSD